MAASGNKPSSASKKKKPTKKEEDNYRQERLHLQLEMEQNIQREIMFWLAIAVSIILEMSNFGLCGGFGDKLSAFLKGISGWMAYLIPVLVFVSSYVSFYRKGNEVNGQKRTGFLLMILFVCMALSMVTYHGTVVTPAEAFHNASQTETADNLLLGGGFIGGLLQWVFVKLFAQGAWIINIVMLIISAILISGKSAMHSIENQGKRAVNSARETNEKVMRNVAHRQEDRNLRKARKYQGIGKDTKVGETSASDSSDGIPDMPEVVVDTYPSEEDIIAAAAETSPADRAEAASEKTASEKTASGQPADPAEGLRRLTVPNFGKGSRTSDRRAARSTSDSASIVNYDLGAHSGSGKTAGGVRQNQPGPAADRNAPAEPNIPAAAHETRAAAEAEDEELFALQSLDLINEEADADYSDTDYPEADYETADTFPYESSVPASPEMPETAEASANGSLPASGKSRKTYISAAEKETGIQAVADQAAQNEAQLAEKPYVFPPVSLLTPAAGRRGRSAETLARETQQKLEKTLQDFGVDAKVTGFSCGPAVTRFEIQPAAGVKVSKIVGLTDDIKLNLAAADIRIEAPIPGKSAVGIEVPNAESSVVSFRELIESEEFKSSSSKITFAVGKDLGGNTKVADIGKMPHVLIAGATGSGKSVCINTIIMSILYKAKPDEVKLIMIDPKVVELSVYNGIPHLMIPVVTDPKKAAGALNWAVQEMTNRYQDFAEMQVRDIKGYNNKVASMPLAEGQERPAQMPKIVIIVDELADLMMVASKDVEEAICRLAQLARAAGIHLVIATQRPSVNVITGLIKANMPSRIAFAVTSGIDSRTILDMNGAEKLLGKGDMLFDPQGAPKPMRIQGAFVSDEDVQSVVDYVKAKNGVSVVSSEVLKKVESLQASGNTTITIAGDEPQENGRDPLFAEAAKIIVDKDKASIGSLQRYLKVGFNRAARIMDSLEEAGVVGPEEGTKPRTILMDREQLEEYLEQNG